MFIISNRNISSHHESQRNAQASFYKYKKQNAPNNSNNERMNLNKIIFLCIYFLNFTCNLPFFSKHLLLLFCDNVFVCAFNDRN